MTCIAASASICVNNPRTLGAWKLPAQRARVGIPGDYKPKLVLLPGGDLLMLAFCSLGSETAGTCHEPTLAFRSQDGGLSWSPRQVVDGIVGREHGLTCTGNGTLFCETHLIAADRRNRQGMVHSYLHRSTDDGRTWQAISLRLDEKRFTGGSSTIVELADGTLLFGVSIGEGGPDFLWISRDSGRTWDTSLQVRLGSYRGSAYRNLVGFFTEDCTFATASGKLLHWVRLSDLSPLFPMLDGRVVPGGNDDQSDRMLLCESRDNGATWSDFVDFGGYGMMYPRVIRLRDGRLLMTYTQRAFDFPLGLRAILSHDDGETWDFSSDRIVIEGKTPWGRRGGGGFGNTVQWTDGSLVSCYSFRGEDDETHIEVARWSLDARDRQCSRFP